MRRRCHKRPAPVQSPDRDALVDRLRPFDRVVEVGIGRQTDVAAALAAHGQVTATDVVDRPVPPGVTFVRDDVTRPDPTLYAGADTLYSINLPSELHRPLSRLGAELGIAVAFTTFGTEGPAVPAVRDPIGGDTLYWPQP